MISLRKLQISGDNRALNLLTDKIYDSTLFVILSRDVHKKILDNLEAITKTS